MDRRPGFSRTAETAAAFIQARLPVAPAPSVPEVRLHLAGPSSGLRRWLAGRAGDQAAPYWAYVWGGGAVLARHILDRPRTVADRRVLDLGAGGGIVAIAAALAGARAVTAAEIDPNGRAALALNAALNGVEVAVVGEDLLAGEPPAGIDLVLVGDLFYAPDLAVRTTAFLDRCLAAGLEILVGDPGRAPLPLVRLALIAEYAVADFGDGPAKPARPAGVYAYSCSPASGGAVREAD